MLPTVTIVAIVVLVALIVLLILRGSADQTRVLSDVRERLGALAEVTRRLEAMGASVTEVQQLLQVPKLRGTLGEIWLEELLRQILPASHYEMQHAFRSGERVDAVLTLGDRLVAVDAKFPLEACQRMLAAGGAAAERERRPFARSLRERIDEIAGMEAGRHAREIAERLSGLRQHLDAFWAAFQTVGAHLSNAQKKCDESERLARRVRDRFERIAGGEDGEP